MDKKDDKCVYCNSRSYGRPCIYSPTNVHMHLNNGGKCVYCGSSSSGNRCIYNPYSKYHIMGTNYLSGLKESVEKTIILKYLVEKIVNSETVVYSPLGRFYFRLWESIKNFSEPLLETFKLSTSLINHKENTDMSQVIEFKRKLSKDVKSLHETLGEFKDISSEDMERAIIDVILDNTNYVNSGDSQCSTSNQ